MIRPYKAICKCGEAIQRWFIILVAAAVMLLPGSGGCTDAGTDPPALPEITAIIPDSAAVGDTIRILGSNFGNTKGTSSVTIGGQVAVTTIFWSDTEIQAVVPSSAATGTVVVSVDGRSSNSKTFKLLVATPPTTSFQTDIYPLFSLSQYGCNSCHTGGGSIGWYSTNNASGTYANLVDVSANTGSCAGMKRVLAGNANQSVLYLRLAGTSCGDRMPQGGNPISSVHLSLIQTWINEGAPF
ncbi:MAG: IPT/TIG domain-containing protein [Ignavibacteriales bacterium]|nr:IPT/TIG domain-containing protein [Ignavibacteriales bacterium]